MQRIRTGGQIAKRAGSEPGLTKWQGSTGLPTLAVEDAFPEKGDRESESFQEIRMHLTKPAPACSEPSALLLASPDIRVSNSLWAESLQQFSQHGAISLAARRKRQICRQARSS